MSNEAEFEPEDTAEGYVEDVPEGAYLSTLSSTTKRGREELRRVYALSLVLNVYQGPVPVADAVKYALNIEEFLRRGRAPVELKSITGGKA